MSYILDALKKAEAERKLGAVPGIHAPATYAAGRAHRSRRTLWIGGALAALTALLAALAWLRPWHTPHSAGLPVMPELAQLAPAKLPPASVEPALKPLPAPVPDQPPPSQSSQSSRIKRRRQPRACQRRCRSNRLRQAAAPATGAETGRRAARRTAGKEPEPLTLRELPEQIQREIPALKIGGYIYSNNPAERSLLINNKLLREGDEVAPGLTLEKMLRGSVVLNYKGYRYRIAY